MWRDLPLAPGYVPGAVRPQYGFAVNGPPVVMLRGTIRATGGGALPVPEFTGFTMTEFVSPFAQHIAAATVPAAGAAAGSDADMYAVMLNPDGDGRIRLGDALAGKVTEVALSGSYSYAPVPVRAREVVVVPRTGWWRQYSGKLADASVPIGEDPRPRDVVQATGDTTFASTDQTPYVDGVLYRVDVQVRTADLPASGAESLWVGAMGVAADGNTAISPTGADTAGDGFYVCAAGRNLDPAEGWVTLTGYLKGTTTDPAQMGTAPRPSPDNPGAMYAGTKFMRVLVQANAGTADGLVQFAAVSITPSGGSSG